MSVVPLANVKTRARENGAPADAFWLSESDLGRSPTGGADAEFAPSYRHTVSPVKPMQLLSHLNTGVRYRENAAVVKVT